MAQLYANENFPQPVVEELRRLGHKVLTTQEAGEAEKSVPDEQVLAFATAAGRILVTLNRKHFIHLHNTNSDHAGIIVCTFDSDFAGQALRIHTAIGSKAQLSGELIRINRPPQ
jgi:predicted nuclease of predicted toxin-antitoxin system